MFVDGDHSYEGVRSDIECWLPKVLEGGVVAFHDYRWSPGVKKAVDEIVQNGIIQRGELVSNLFYGYKAANVSRLLQEV
ncbi:MAG: class I SAM-dependent methyltransferase [Anaerolineae bacterium]|nr:class I SAM-dependent methyltransferase [Anaerolineae bacterium]